MTRKMNSSDCTTGSCGCKSSVTRRDFLRLSSLAAATSFVDWQAVAGPFEGADFQNLVPADKKLNPDWVKSLYERGEPMVYHGAELGTIGMPVNGICSGQLYLGGDGRLWYWDIFNQSLEGIPTDYSGRNYAKPLKPESPIEQGFGIKLTSGGKAQVRCLDSRGFSPSTMGFKGQYPMGFVDYKDPTLPVQVSLEAFTPFIPLDVDDSSLPVTIMNYTVKNTGTEAVEVEIGGWIENGVCLESGRKSWGRRRNKIQRDAGLTMVASTAESLPEKDRPAIEPDVLFEDFENGYEKWTVEGTAFGKTPAAGTLANQQTVSGFEGKGLVNSFLEGDDTVGRMQSKPFTIARRYIAFLIGGGRRKGEICMNLLIDGRVQNTASGQDREKLEWAYWDVSQFQGKQASLEIVDKATGAWGHINVDQIVFTDQPPAARTKVEEQQDFGSLALALLGDGKDDFAQADVKGELPTAIFADSKELESMQAFGTKLIGSVGRKFSLAPGAEGRATFLVAWFFPGLQRGTIGGLEGIDKLQREYANRFDSGAAVARHVAKNFEQLAGQTRLWNQTWYDSTLPYWFLDRVFAPICTLATSTCYRFNNGRFYAFEGVYCCQGTCQHVWNYAQSVGRIFPELERDLRRRTDFGTAWHENGAIDYRGECDQRVAHDGQCGVILRAWREHQMAPDDSYLRACWPRIRKSVEYLIGCDVDENGLIEGEQYNTLDASWYGAMAWISSFYIAALRAAEAMAGEVGDEAFAKRCRTIAERGSQELVKQLYNGEYFIHKPDSKHPEGTNTNDGCHIDQLMGQAWALQVGLPRVIPRKETVSALEAIWKYNFTPDVGPYREKSYIKGGRWYAMPGEGGVVMTTFPKGGIEKASGKGGFAHYFNEVWTGQEHQLAAHMLWEGMTDKALVITRFVHDRHHAARRNPYNEIECSDHYTRAMASHGTFIAACGYEHHGPQGHLGFAPRLSPENFRAPFTAAEGWGTFSQTRQAQAQKETIAVKYGKLRLRTLAFEMAEGFQPSGATLVVKGEKIKAPIKVEGRRVTVTCPNEMVIVAGESIDLLFG
jgi:uncharacterized protein (DUF608 family)